MISGRRLTRVGKVAAAISYDRFNKMLLPVRLKRYEIHGRFNDISELRSKTLAYVNALTIKEAPYGQHLFSKSRNHPVLYASIYAAMLRHLYNDLGNITQHQRDEWASYILSYQCDDGLFRDPAVANEIAEVEDWWGWRHLTGHAITALTVLGARPQKPFRFLEELYSPGGVLKWLESRDWTHKAAFVSNQVMNYGVLMQYSRDFCGDDRADRALSEIYHWLEEHQDPLTGLWGPRPADAHGLSLGVQTAYHIWILYFYDKRPINYLERCIDSCLKTQNIKGGFGLTINSSACEDIDTIDPLSRFFAMTDYRHEDIRKALEKSLRWVLVNANGDGGFVFRRCERLEYGHELTSSVADESALFPTWFRTLSLSYLSKVVKDPFFCNFHWQIVRCPGYQF